MTIHERWQSYKERREHMQEKGCSVYKRNQVLSYRWVWSPCVAEPVPETRSSSVPSSDWRSALCSLSWLWNALEQSPHWPFKTQAKGEMNSCYKSQMWFEHLRTWLVFPLRAVLASGISAPPAWFWPDSPEHTSSEPPRSKQANTQDPSQFICCKQTERGR